MQKKKIVTEEPQKSSNWQSSFNSQARKEQMKKYGIWGGIILATVIGFVLLVRMAGTTTQPQAPVEIANLRAVDLEKDMILGDKNAPVTIVEYVDFQCPACASYNPLVNKILADYQGKVRVVNRHFPLSVHQHAKISGQAAYAAWKLGKFSEMKNKLFDNQLNWSNTSDPSEIFAVYATEIGLNKDAFTTLMKSQEAKVAVEEGEREAISLGLNSTPTFIVNGKQIAPRGYDDFKTIIDEELAKK
jgi:protein-disulfide isomerase